jgi:hypothetical protein
MENTLTGTEQDALQNLSTLLCHWTVDQMHPGCTESQLEGEHVNEVLPV